MQKVILQICNPTDYDPLNAKFDPETVMEYEVNYSTDDYWELTRARKKIIMPFLQHYEYLVIGFDSTYSSVKLIPYCHFSKRVFELQLQNL